MNEETIRNRRILRTTSLGTWYPLDSLVWICAVLVAAWVRFEMHLGAIGAGVVLLALAVPVGVLIGGLLTGLYMRRYLPASFDEAAALGISCLVVTTGGFALTQIANTWLAPRSVPILAGPFALIGMFTVRFIVRAMFSRHPKAEGKRALVFGAGHYGRTLIRQLKDAEQPGFIPVAALDDDARLRNMTISGVRVLGSRGDLAALAHKHDAQVLIIAVGSANSDLVRDLKTRANAAGLDVMILPPISEMMNRAVGPGELREINVHDLLGRQPVSLDEASISDQIMGKKVLVTGAGGSIGSELCRQLNRFAPAELIMLDRDESALHAVQLSIEGKAMLDSPNVVLTDIRDSVALDRIFAEHTPDIVFHAAALKHLPLLERYPIEAWKSNVVGTANVLEAAQKSGVGIFVNISTDKAADPTSVLGYSKRLAERLTAEIANRAPGTYVSVRFGNVLGSRGSVLTAFEQQIREGGPVTVTHPDVTRYFMTIAEACQLVLQASTVGQDGQVMILDMGEPIKILDVAKTLIEQSGRDDIEIVFTGLREGEKMHEELFGKRETDAERVHPMVSHASVPPLSLEEPGSMNQFTRHADAYGHLRQTALDSADSHAAVALPKQIGLSGNSIPHPLPTEYKETVR